jgi:hypothetical protein
MPDLGAFAHHALLRIQFSNSSRLLTRLRDLAACCARGLPEFPAPEYQRAQGMPGAQCTRSLVCNKKTHELVTTGTPEITRHSPRNGFTAYFALSPVTRLV